MDARKVALAVGALASISAGAAEAQTPFTWKFDSTTLNLYGNVDYYLNYQRSSSGSDIVSLQDGAYQRTRIGFKVDNAVAEGYTIKFQAEQGLNDTNGGQADTTRLFDRQFWAGLASPAGEFRIGRQNSAIFTKGAYIDNTARTLGSVINSFGVPSRYDSDFAYISPRWSGFQFEGHYSIQGSTANHVSNQAVYQLAVEWAGGPWRAGYAGIVGQPPSGSPIPDKVKYDNLYGNWDYGKGKVYLALVRSNNNSTTAGSPGILNNGGAPLGNTGALVTGTDPGAQTFYKVYQVSADYQATPKLRVGGLVGKIVAEDRDDADATGWSFAGYYDVFKNTILYGIIDQIKNDPNAGFRPQGSASLTKTFTDANDVNGRTISGVHVGFVYKF
jgi:predicted porin